MSIGAAKRPNGLREVAVSKRRTVGLSDRGWEYKGAGTPIVRGQAAKGLCASKPQRVGRWGLGRNEVSPFGATRLNAFDAPTAKRDATGEVQTVSLAKMCGRTNLRFRTTHTSCNRRKAIGYHKNGWKNTCHFGANGWVFN